MSHSKITLTLTILSTTILLTLVALGLTIQPVRAQCKPPSQCKDCHENKAQKPVSTFGNWHIDHAANDFCFACHAGNSDATAASAAHTGMLTKLDQMQGSCKTCHATDLETKYKSYADTLGVSAKIDPNAGSTGSSVQKTLGTLLGAGPANIPLPTAAAASPNPANPKPQNPILNWFLAGALLISATGGGYYVVRNERRLGNAPPANLTAFVRYIRRESWSPYAAGVLLGLLCILSVLLAHRTLGASTGVATLSSDLVNASAPSAVASNMYFKFIITPGLNFEVLLLGGMFLGGLISALVSRTFRLRWNDDPTWRKIFGPQGWKRIVFGFIGALFLQFGAGIAGGCTSGLAISGGMLLAPSAFIFMAGMFASGILVALIVYRRRY